MLDTFFYYCQISEKYTIWGQKFARNYVYRPDQGNIVGREYIISSKCLAPYGILLADLTIAGNT
jgi:hypothetical protein